MRYESDDLYNKERYYRENKNVDNRDTRETVHDKLAALVTRVEAIRKISFGESSATIEFSVGWACEREPRAGESFEDVRSARLCLSLEVSYSDINNRNVEEIDIFLKRKAREAFEGSGLPTEVR